MTDKAVLDEYQTLLEGTGFVVLPQQTQIKLTGADRVSFLHSFCTNDITALCPGEGCEAFITSVQGKILAYVFVFCHSHSLIVESKETNSFDLIRHFDRYLIREDVQLHDQSEQFSQILLSGSGWLNLLSHFTDQIPVTPLAHVNGQLNGQSISIRSVELTGSNSFLCRVVREAVPAVCQSLRDKDALECGTEALEITRVEAGIPVAGVDVTEENFPQEVGRDDKTINFNKGCYLGQETVARIDALGRVNWMRVGLRFESAKVPTAGLELTDQGKTTGRVTSAVWSPRLKAPLAMAYVRHNYATVGDNLDSSLGLAEVVRFPAFAGK